MGLFDELFGAITGDGCSGALACVNASGALSLNTAMAILADVVGTYGIIEQWKIQKRMVELAERSKDRADKFLAQVKVKYTDIDLPVWQRTADLYDRYATKWPIETCYLNEAFALKGYCPDYCLAEGRAVQSVQRQFDLAYQAKRRSLSRYDTGRACHDLTHFMTSLVAAKTNAAMQARVVEQEKKLLHDKWYWERFRAAADYLTAMGNRSVNALTGGASGLAHGMSSINRSVDLADDGNQSRASALANSAQFWGNVAEGGLGGFGTAVGSGYFSSSPAATNTTTYTSLKDSAPAGPPIAATQSFGGYIPLK